MKKSKLPIQIRLWIDPKEKDVNYVHEILKSEPTKDGIEFFDYIVESVKPLGIKYSTTDLSILYRKKGNKEWIETNLGIEIKKGIDSLSSIYTAENRDRLYFEIDRASAYGMTMYFVITDTIEDIRKKASSLPMLKDKHADSVYFKELVKLNRKLNSEGFDGVIVSGYDGLAFVLKRIIKMYVQDNKLNYF